MISWLLATGAAAHFLSQVVSESKSAETTIGNTRLLPFYYCKMRARMSL